MRCPKCGTALRCPTCEQSTPTPTELRVLKALCQDGAPTDEIGRRLKMSPKTVKTHLQNLMRKYGTHNRTELAVKAMRTGVVPLERTDI